MELSRYLLTKRLGADATLYVSTLSGAMDVLTDSCVAEIHGIAAGTHSTDSDFAQRMRQRMYLVESREEEHEVLLRLREKMRIAAQREPTIFAISPTYSCFFRCGYCYEGELTSSPASHAVGVRDFLDGMANMRAFLTEHLELRDRPHVTFIGGETLQESTRSVVLGILDEGARDEYVFRIITNGFLLHTFLDDLVRVRDTIQFVQITLDGPARVHDVRRPLAGGGGTFSRIVANLELALDAGLSVLLRTNVDQANVHALTDLARFVHDRGWPARPNFRAYLAPVEDSTCRGLSLAAEDALLREWLGLREGPDAALFASFDDTKLFRVTDMLESIIRGARRRALPRMSYCAATKAKAFLFGPDGYIYQCLRGVGDLRTSVGTFHPRFDVSMDRISAWLERDVTRMSPGPPEHIATLHGGGCALESLKKTGTLHMCVSDDAEHVIDNYLEFRKDAILRKVNGGTKSAAH
jgi:uncharacterized protein